MNGRSTLNQITLQLVNELHPNLNPPLNPHHPHRDYYDRFIVAHTFLGVSIPKSGGVHQLLVPVLRRAENLLINNVNAGRANQHGIYHISGFQLGFHELHSWGLAIDINYFSNPYIMHERREANLDTQLAQVYHRIARFILGRDSLIPSGITMDRQPSGQRWGSRTRDLYNGLAEESSAMQEYFTIMQSLTSIQNYIRTNYQSYLLAFAHASPNQVSRPPDYQDIQRQMMADWTTLTSQPGPTIQDPSQSNRNSSRTLAYPPPSPIQGDRPFDLRRRRYNSRRTPINGFLDLRFEVVEALTTSGLVWGAIHFGNHSGDIMHFQMTNSDPLVRTLLNLIRRRHS